MYNDLIDGIQFNKNPKLHRPKISKGKPRRRRNLIPKLLRIFYFCLILFILYKSAIYGIECFIAFSGGTERRPIGEFIERLKED